jgi:hypothetical protein
MARGTLEIQEHDEEVGHKEVERPGCIFPLAFCGCCPIQVRMMIPGTFQTIQSWTHLVLMVGTTICVLLVLTEVVEAGNFILNPATLGKEKATELPLKIARGVMCLAFVPLCIAYFIKIITQFDDRLQAKQADCKRQKENLTKAYNNLLSDMDGLLTKSAESSAGLAERTFENKRRDFQRFLERAKSRYGSAFLGTPDEKKMLDAFKRFVKNWLHVFEECSIDPVSKPKRVVTDEEIMDKKTLADVCDTVLERLRVTEVRFISAQRDQDAQMLRKQRNDFRRLSSTESAPTGILAIQDAHNAGRQLLERGKQAPRKCGWLSCGFFCTRRPCSSGCYCLTPEPPEKYPKEIGLSCMRVVLLSREHWGLIFAFLIGLGLCGIEMEIMRQEKYKDDAVNAAVPKILGVIVNQICLAFILARFEELDVLQQLEREVKELRKAEKDVTDKREKMNEFWGQAQNLTELWLYRTVPRLDLWKEVQECLVGEDMVQEEISGALAIANQQLERLDEQLHPLHDWKDEGQLSLQAKKTFAQTIKTICQEGDWNGVAKKLMDENMKTKDGYLLCLEGKKDNHAGGKSHKR